MVAFSDINPKAPVHILLAPKKHLESLQVLGEGDIALIGKLVWRAKDLARDQGISDGYKLIFNGGQLQKVSHLHLHLLGGWKAEEKVSEVAFSHLII